MSQCQTLVVFTNETSSQDDSAIFTKIAKGLLMLRWGTDIAVLYSPTWRTKDNKGHF
jgi:hypothetical protein